MTLTLELKCKKHPTYKARRAPRTAWCPACEMLWAMSPDSVGKVSKIEHMKAPGLLIKRRQ